MAEERPLPSPDAAREWLEAMTLIRRFEERAGEMYAKAKVGGFLHLAIGEEATIVGAVRAMRDDDYLISTYRSHGHALARGTDPDNVMAELFGREDGVSKGRGGSMHMFDGERRFMGGYGIVGGNLPLAAGMALASDYKGTDEVTVCVFGDGAANQGTFGETLNLAALWRLPVVFMVTNNQFGMGTALERHSAVTDLHRRGEGIARVDDAVAFADRSPFPAPESLYDSIYVLGDQVRGWYSVDERSAGVHKGEDERDMAAAERGPEGAYGDAVEQAKREDVGLEKGADEAQAEDDEAEQAESWW